MSLNECTVDVGAFEWFEALGYAVAYGPRHTLLPKLLSGELKVSGLNPDASADRMLV